MDGKERQSSHALIEPLTDREKQILSLLARHLTNQEIAGEIALSLNSVKWYIRKIYNKLEVQSRRQAVVRAREVGLLITVSPSTSQVGQTSPKHNLPAQLTSFIGREKEIEEILRLTTEHRLVTLTGAGGVGKSRLAIQSARKVLERYPQGVWLVELASVRDPTRAPQAVIEALNLVIRANQTALAVLQSALRSKRILLVMDNCEHMVKASAQLVEALMAACVGLRIIATSREALGIEGEYAYTVPSLTFPGLNKLPPLEEFNQFEAVALFADRARQILPDFAITEENAPAVAIICQRLDGLPLALELAAARLGVLSAEGIARRLEDRFRLLTGGSRNAMPHQRTLYASIDWSYMLLSTVEQIIFRRLSIFVGGWTLEAAEAVCAGEDLPNMNVSSPNQFQTPSLDRSDILSSLTSLVGKSLLISIDGPGTERRYQMLESIREYAMERLEESGETEMLRKRHALFFLNLVKEAEPQSRGPETKAWLSRLDTEYGNIRASLGWSLGGGAVEAGLRAAPDLLWYWHQRGPLSEGRAWLDSALALSDSIRDRTIKAEILRAAGVIAWEQGEFSIGGKRIEESLSIWEELGDLHGIAVATFYSSLVRQEEDRFDEHRASLEKSVRIFREIDDSWWLATSLQWLGNLIYLRGEKQIGRAYEEEGESIFRRLGASAGLAWSLQHLASFDWDTGDIDMARARFHESLALHRESGEQWGEGWSLSLLADLEFSEAKGAEDYRQAERYYQEGVDLFRELGVREFVTCSLLHRLGRAVQVQGDLQRAIELYQESLTIGGELVKTGSWYISLILVGPAEAAIELGKPERGARLLGAMEALSGSFLETVHPIHKKDYQQMLSKARANLDEAVFYAAVEEGRGLTMEQAIREGIIVLSKG